MGNPNYIVGHDEHGPAYPDPASQWPHHPSRPLADPEPDDAEYEHFKREHGIDDERSVPWPVALVGWAVMVAVLVYMAWH